MTMNKKGQALVEFVIILPIFLMLVFTVIDFGRVIYVNNNLESINTDVVDFYKNGKTKEEINSIINNNEDNKVDISINVRENYTDVIVSKEIKPITPGLSLIAEKVFKCKSQRVIRNE